MQQAAKFQMPIITFVDTPGAYPGIAAEERVVSGDRAQPVRDGQLPAPIIAVLTGEEAAVVRSRSPSPTAS